MYISFFFALGLEILIVEIIDFLAFSSSITFEANEGSYKVIIIYYRSYFLYILG